MDQPNVRKSSSKYSSGYKLRGETEICSHSPDSGSVGWQQLNQTNFIFTIPLLKRRENGREVTIPYSLSSDHALQSSIFLATFYSLLHGSLQFLRNWQSPIWEESILKFTEPKGYFEVIQAVNVKTTVFTDVMQYVMVPFTSLRKKPTWSIFMAEVFCRACMNQSHNLHPKNRINFTFTTHIFSSLQYLFTSCGDW